LRVRRIERASAPEAVRDQILELIQEGELTVGSKLPSEQEMARSFGVSRPVVREGLGRLRSIGVIESRSGSGSFVRSARIAPQGLLLAGGYTSDELHEIRSEIEVQEHTAIVEAIRRRDRAGAAAAMQSHLNGIRRRLAPTDWSPPEAH